MDEELKALETIKQDLNKLLDKYSIKAQKERTKVNDIYVTVCGEKCYTEQEINEWIEADYINSTQADRYIEKLEAKQQRAGQEGGETKSERLKRICSNLISNLNAEIHNIKYIEEQRRKKEERWEIAQAQGLSYKQWLELEEISQRSEDYEILMGLKRRKPDAGE